MFITKLKNVGKIQKFKKKIKQETVHIMKEGPTFRPADADSELAGARPARLHDEATLVRGQDAVLHAGPVYPNLAGVRP